MQTFFLAEKTIIALARRDDGFYLKRTIRPADEIYNAKPKNAAIWTLFRMDKIGIYCA